jgi:hypothetical protein
LSSTATSVPSRRHNHDNPSPPAQVLLVARCVSADLAHMHHHGGHTPAHTAQAPADTCCMHTGPVWVTQAACVTCTNAGRVEGVPNLSRAQALQEGAPEALPTLLHCHKAHNNTRQVQRSDKCMLHCILLLPGVLHGSPWPPHSTSPPAAHTPVPTLATTAVGSYTEGN